jgi:hypothetical protein
MHLHSGVQYHSWGVRQVDMAELSALEDFYIHYFKEFHCRDCGSDVAYVSRPRTLTEKYFLPVMRMKTVRCGDCFRRYVRPVSLPARARELLRRGPNSQTSAPPTTGSRVA